MYMIQTCLYSFTTTLHFPSGQISLATPTSLSSAQAPLLQSSLLPVISLYVHTDLYYHPRLGGLSVEKNLQGRPAPGAQNLNRCAHFAIGLGSFKNSTNHCKYPLT